MTTPDHSRPRAAWAANEREPAAWAATLERFRGAAGSEFDPGDATDCRLFVELLEEEIRHRVRRELADLFREETASARIEREITDYFRTAAAEVAVELAALRQRDGKAGQ